jgi:hypothetical protein
MLSLRQRLPRLCLLSAVLLQSLPIRLRRIWLLSVVSLLSACASQAPLPATVPLSHVELPLQLHIQRQAIQTRSAGPQAQPAAAIQDQSLGSQDQPAAAIQDWLLVIQHEPGALRWSLLDPLGLPLARQLLTQGQWRNDGLLPPNPEARELFAALLFALSPRAELPRAYPGLDWQADAEQRRLSQPPRRWQVQYRQPAGFELRVGEGLRYIVKPLVQDANPHPAPPHAAQKTPHNNPQAVPTQRPGAQP